MAYVALVPAREVLMLKTFALSSFFVAALVCGTAMAQTDNSPPGQGVPPPGAAMGAPPSNKDLIANCRADARAKGLRGHALKSAVVDCVGAQNPKVAARMRCAQQGKAQGVMAGDAMKAFVRNCVAQGKQ